MPRRKPANPPRRVPPRGSDDAPSLIELDRFDSASLRRWADAGKKLDALQRALYFELESLRQQHRVRLQDAIRAAATARYDFETWSRIVDYRYTLEPLSVAGSIGSDGGRFNIGAKLGPGTFTAFPALYVAEDYATALRERFCSDGKQMSGAEFALRTPASFTQVRLRGHLESVIDVGDLSALKPFAAILSEFQMPKAIVKLARDLGMSNRPWLIRSPTTLQKFLLHPNWRAIPIQFGLPANSQIFGRMVSAAGIHGLVYPSARNSPARCVALYPQNWRSSSSFVEVMDGAPSGARVTRIDGSSRELT